MAKSEKPARLTKPGVQKMFFFSNYHLLFWAIMTIPLGTLFAKGPCDSPLSQYVVSVRVAHVNDLDPEPKAGLYVDGTARDCVDRIFNFTLYLEESESNQFEIKRLGMKVWQSKIQELREINDKTLLERAANDAITSFSETWPTSPVRKFSSVAQDGTLYLFDHSEFSYLSKSKDEVLKLVKENTIDLGYVMGDFWIHSQERWKKGPWIFLPGTLYDGGTQFLRVGNPLGDQALAVNPPQYKLSLIILNLLDAAINGKVLAAQSDQESEKKPKTLLPGFLYSWAGVGWTLIKEWTPFSHELDIYFDLGVVTNGDGTEKPCQGHLGRESFESLFELSLVQLVGRDLKSKQGKAYSEKLKYALSARSKDQSRFNQQELSKLFLDVANDLSVALNTDQAVQLFKDYFQHILEEY